MNFQRHPFDPLIMRRREIKARVIRVSYLKIGGVVTDTNCQRASQSLYETIAVSLFVRLPPRALLAASPLARDSCSATFFPRIFEQKRDCSQSRDFSDVCLYVCLYVYYRICLDFTALELRP